MSDAWVRVPLGSAYNLASERVDPASLSPEATYVGLEHLQSGTPRISQSGRTADVKSLVSVFTRGDTLFGRLRPYLKKVAYAEDAGYCSPEILVLRPRTEVVEPGFLHLLASSDACIEHAVALSAGSRMPRTSGPDLASFEVSMPPLSVQRRIVDLMKAIDNQISSLRAEQSAVEGLLMLVRRGSWPNAPMIRIGDVTRALDGGRSPLTSGEAPQPGKPSVLKLSAVRPGAFDGSEAKRIDSIDGMPSNAQVSVGDLLISRSNTPDRVGYVARVRSVDDATYFPDLMWRVRLDESRCDPDFFEQLLSSPWGRALVAGSASGTSASMRKINKRGFSSLRIPLPTLAEQRDYADRCLGVSELISTQNGSISSLECLRSTLLSGLLDGSLQVPEDYDILLSGAA